LHIRLIGVDLGRCNYGDAAQAGAGYDLPWLAFCLVVRALPDCTLLRNQYATDCAVDQGLTAARVVGDSSAVSSCIGGLAFQLRLSVTGFLFGRDLDL